METVKEPGQNYYLLLVKVAQPTTKSLALIITKCLRNWPKLSPIVEEFVYIGFAQYAKIFGNMPNIHACFRIFLHILQYFGIF